MGNRYIGSLSQTKKWSWKYKLRVKWSTMNRVYHVVEKSIFAYKPSVSLCVFLCMVTVLPVLKL